MLNPVEYITDETDRFSSEASICAARLSLILLMNLMAERPVSDFIFLYNVGLDSPISSHNSSTPNSVSGICSSMTDIRFFRNRSSEVVPEMADGSTEMLFLNDSLILSLWRIRLSILEIRSSVWKGLVI